jgi:hypothetical protein
MIRCCPSTRWLLVGVTRSSPPNTHRPGQARPGQMWPIGMTASVAQGVCNQHEQGTTMHASRQGRPAQPRSTGTAHSGCSARTLHSDGVLACGTGSSSSSISSSAATPLQAIHVPCQLCHVPYAILAAAGTAQAAHPAAVRAQRSTQGCLPPVTPRLRPAQGTS